jgi:diacylglycerol kinase (ATP)
MRPENLATFLERRLLKTLRYSVNGFKAAWRTEEAFRVEVFLFPPFCVLAFWVSDSAAETAVLLTSLFVVLIAELLNTGLEKIVDRISLDHHENSRFVKDVGSAAVSIALLQFIVVWLVIIFL